jgi:hypothetical protein
MTAAALPLLAALTLVAVHWITPRLRWLSNAPRSRWLSFAGGASIAYVFLHLLPEIAHGEEALREEAGRHAFGGFGIWGVALAALVGFYGIERMVQRNAMRRTARDEEDRPGVFYVHLASFAVYNLVTGYLLVNRVPTAADASAAVELVIFAIAMALHLMVTDFGLIEAFRDGYLRLGRWLLSGAVLAGWAVGAASEIPEVWIAVVVAILGGGVILNVLKEELPRERDSRFGALLVGVLAFAALIWALEVGVERLV